MISQPSEPRTGRTRMCLATRAVLPESELIRFVAGPDGAIVPDLKARLPGRGAWVRATRADLEGATRRSLLSRALKVRAPVDAALPDQVAALLRKAALGRLGLARKAGGVVNGFTRTSAALSEGKAIVLLTASDAAPDSRRKMMAVRARHRDDGAAIAAMDIFAGAELDLALGAANVIHAAVLRGAAGRSFRDAANKLLRFEGCSETEGPIAGSTGRHSNGCDSRPGARNSAKRTGPACMPENVPGRMPGRIDE